MTLHISLGDDEVNDGDEEPPLSITAADPEWKEFEKEVHRLHTDMKDGDCQHDARLKGVVSGIERQVDVLLTGALGGSRVRIAIECKRYASRIGIGKVDEFIGKLLDLEVDRGILYTINGATSGALKRAQKAQHPVVEIRVLSEDTVEGSDWDALLDRFTPNCPGLYCYSGEIRWRDWAQPDGSKVSAGYCDSCGSFTIKCPACESATLMVNASQSCDWCDNTFELEYDRKGSDIENVLVHRADSD